MDVYCVNYLKLYGCLLCKLLEVICMFIVYNKLRSLWKIDLIVKYRQNEKQN